MKLDVIKLDATKVGDIDLDDAIYGLEPRADILHRVVTWQANKARSGTRKIKTRSEISRTGHKFGNQKGGGGARHGDRKSNIFRGGAKAHGPVVRSHDTDLPKKVRKLGLRHALSSKAGAKTLIILDDAKLGAPKTKDLKAAFEKLGVTSALVIDGADVDQNFLLAAKNIPHVDVLPAQGANVRDILGHETLVLTRQAIEQLEARLK